MFDVFATVIGLVAAFVAPVHYCAGILVSRRVIRFAARRAFLAVSFGSVSSLVLCIAFAMIAGLPLPSVHDEFAYLLGADTFSSGRLTNPTHPLWESFETFHVIHQPTYQMKYPPAQAAFLGLGQRLGEPIWGVWISLALACGATTWMLRAWTPPRWALLGGWLTVMHAGILRYWGEGYMGGAVAMLGGALVWGAVPRLLRPFLGRAGRSSSITLSNTIGNSAAFGVGIALLANSRPYEGLLTTLFAGLVFVWFVVTSPRSVADSRSMAGNVTVWASIAAPAVVVVVAAGAWMLHYNKQVTHDRWKMPYQVWQAIYSDHGKIAGTLLLAGGESVAERRVPVPEESYQRQRAHEPLHRKLFRLMIFFFRPYVWVPLSVLLPWLMAKRNLIPVLGVSALFVAVIIQDSGGYPHYAASVAPLAILLIVQGLRHLRVVNRPNSLYGGMWGRNIVTLLPVVAFATVVADTWQWRVWNETPGFAQRRDAIVRHLLDKPGEDLVVVRYRSTHSIYDEWVYNRADIDGSPIVWARELTSEQNQKLLDYYVNRHAWLLDADAEPPELRHFRMAETK
ncbi:MAG: hypothetical protein R3C99_21460 [Pirellulaceae bacterium]